MVKKVIDIYPPQREEELEPGDEAVEAGQMPSIAPYIETPAKPKITFIAPPQKSAAVAKKAWGLGGVGGLFLKLALILAVIVAVLWVIDARYASAVITITPQAQEVSATKQIFVDTKLSAADLVKQAIPGVVLSIDKEFSGDFKSSGKANTKAKATGTVKISNNFTAVQRLIKGTRLQAPMEKFQPSLGKDQMPWFRTVEDITIQPKSTATVGVVADAPGAQYNIAPSAFSIPGLAGTPQYTYITVQSSDKFTGGTDTAVAQVTQDDLDAAKNSLASIIQDQMKVDLLKKTSDTQQLIPETINVSLGSVLPSVAAGTASETFSYKAKVHATAIAVNKSDLDNFAKALILNNIQSGYDINPADLAVTQKFVKNDPVTNATILLLEAKGNEYPKFDESALARSLAGKSISEATAILNDPKIVQPVSMKLMPYWRAAFPSLFSLPKDSDKITIKQTLK